MPIDRAAFRRNTRCPTDEAIQRQVYDARSGQASARDTLIAAMSWAAFSAPSATQDLFDVIVDAWLGNPHRPLLNSPYDEAPLSDDFWQAYWQVVDGAKTGYDALTITQAVASLGAAVDEVFGEMAEHIASTHPGADDPLNKTVPGLTDIEKLASCAAGTLGQALYSVLKENDFDPEVLDRDSIGLQELPPALRYLNTRILQMHDVWHLVAGYDTTGLQEVAISSFQLAQFGHNYSSMFLAAATAIASENNPRGFPILMQVIAEAWNHGRKSPSLMAVEWENYWHTPIEQLRQELNIQPFRSTVPSDLLEVFSTGSLLQKIKLGVKIMRIQNGIKSLGHAA